MCSITHLHDQKLQRCSPKGSKFVWFSWCTLVNNVAARKCCIIDCDRLLAAQIAMIRTTEGRKGGMVKSRTDVFKGARLKVEPYPDSLILEWLLIIIVEINCELKESV